MNGKFTAFVVAFGKKQNYIRLDLEFMKQHKQQKLRPGNLIIRQHDAFMKNTPIILALSLLLTACSRHDAELTKRISGSWKHEGTSTRDNGTYSSTTIISRDGTFSYMRRWNERPLTFTMAGIWQIKDGFMLMTVTNRSDQDIGAKVGEIIKSRIIRLDNHQFVYEVDGITNILSR